MSEQEMTPREALAVMEKIHEHVSGGWQCKREHGEKCMGCEGFRALPVLRACVERDERAMQPIRCDLGGDVVKQIRHLLASEKQPPAKWTDEQVRPSEPGPSMEGITSWIEEIKAENARLRERLEEAEKGRGYWKEKAGSARGLRQEAIRQMQEAEDALAREKTERVMEMTAAQTLLAVVCGVAPDGPAPLPPLVAAQIAKADALAAAVEAAASEVAGCVNEPDRLAYSVKASHVNYTLRAALRAYRVEAADE